MSDPCTICQGACCESLVFPATNLSEHDREFLLVRGSAFGTDRIQVESICPNLSICGSCNCYDTRPQSCRTFKVGGKGCLDTVNARRFGEQREAILNAIASL